MSLPVERQGRQAQARIPAALLVVRKKKIESRKKNWLSVHLIDHRPFKDLSERQRGNYLQSAFLRM